MEQNLSKKCSVCDKEVNDKEIEEVHEKLRSLEAEMSDKVMEVFGDSICERVREKDVWDIYHTTDDGPEIICRECFNKMLEEAKKGL